MLGRFLQADSIVPAPGNPQSLNRYAYTLNNPLRYTDPSGHFTQDEIEQHLREQGMSDDEIDALIYLWTRNEKHADWWQLLLTAQVGDKLDGIEAGKSVVGFFRAGANGSFNFSSAFGSELIFSVADYYSNNPLDGNAHIRTDIILARKGDSLGLNTDRYVFYGGTDVFANGIPDLPRPDTRYRDLGFVGMAVGVVGMVNGAKAIGISIAGSGPTLGASLAAAVPGIGIFVLGGFSFAEGAVLVVDHYVALREIDYAQNRLQPYAP